MTKPIKQVTDMVIDEISLVDRPANQHAHIVIAKAQGDAVADYFTADGSPVDIDSLQFGDTVFDESGAEYEFVPDEAGDPVEDKAPAGVAKSAFGAPVATSSDSLSTLRAELSKALSDGDRDQVLSKALDQLEVFEKRAAEAENIAKSERNLRLEKEYISKAAEYNVPIDPAELGPVLMRMADSMSYEDCAVIHKSLATAGEILFTELGYQGDSDNVDPYQQVEAYLEEQGGVSKSADAVSKAQSVADFYTHNPAAYDEYVAGLGR